MNEQRNQIQQEMQEIVEVLNSMKGQPGLTEPLVDHEGFPRADVDIYECRKLRNRHACLQTDYKNTMKKLEAQLFGLHDIYKQTDPAHLQKSDKQKDDNSDSEMQII